MIEFGSDIPLAFDGDFYGSGSTYAPTLVAARGTVRFGRTKLESPDSNDTVIGESIRQLSAPQHLPEEDGYTLELLEGMPNGADQTNQELFVTTSNGGIHVNLFEVAVRAAIAAGQGRQLRYFAPQGNSGTHGIGLDEWRAYAQTGSWLRGSGDTLWPSGFIQAVAKTVGQPAVLSATGHGGIVTTALAATLPRGSVKQIIQMDRLGLVPTPLTGQLRDQGQKTEGVSYETNDPRDYASAHSRWLLVENRTDNFRRLPLPFNSLTAVMANPLATRHAGSTIERDFRQALVRQPEAAVTFVVPGADFHPDISVRLGALSRMTEAAVRAIVLPGESRNSLTHKPLLAMAAMYAAQSEG
ncbi:hypothetical protein JNM87_06055 [Candidatus Saccharibacteria bacterium]|nr:hypothetical protein [Candidatus Saccharibacteria bacterium]